MTKLELAIERIDSPSQLPSLGAFLDALPEKVFGLDIETTVTDTVFDRHIRTIQIGNKQKQFVIDLKHFAKNAGGSILDQGFRRTPEWALPLKQFLDKYFLSEEYIKVGHYLRFEYECFYWCLGIKFYNMFCTSLAEQVLNAGKVRYDSSGFYGLEDVVLRRCNFQMDKELQKSFNTEDDLSPEQEYYAALDARVVLAVRLSQQKDADKLGLSRITQIENDALPFFAEMHVNGFRLDRQKWEDTVEFYRQKHIKHLKELDNHFGPLVGFKPNEASVAEARALVAQSEDRWRAETSDKELRKSLRAEYQQLNRTLKDSLKFHEDCEGDALINYGSSQQMLEAINKIAKLKLKDTNDETLNPHKSIPVIKAVQNYRETKKILTTYSSNWYKYINPITGLVHSKINQIGAETGRTSSVSPNLQNVASANKGEPDFHSCFTAYTEFRRLAINDMSGAELRIIAEMSGEPLWVEAFRNNWDVHSVGAEIIFGDRWWASQEAGCAFTSDKQKCKCSLHNELRNFVKAINFGIAYGMEAARLGRTLGISTEEAQVILDKWKDAFKLILKFLTRLGDLAKSTLKATDLFGRIRFFTPPTNELAKAAVLKEKEKAEKKGDTYNITAQRIKRKYMMMYGAIEREGKNHPIQSGNASILKLACGTGKDMNGNYFLWHLLKQYDAYFVNTVHDEVIIDCPAEHAEVVSNLVADAFKRAAAEGMNLVEMKSEGAVNYVWNKK